MTPNQIRNMGLGRLGAGPQAQQNVRTTQEVATLAYAGVTAGSAIAAGASIGSVAGPIGAAVGAIAGIAVGILTPSPNTAAHIGSWDSQLVNALAALPKTVAGIGRQIPWNENSHGLVQYIEALLACGNYMSWDNQLILNYNVCAHWAMTLSEAVRVVAQAVCTNPAGANVTVQVTSQPGGPVGPAPFTFKNPGITTGPEAVTDAVIMGPNGVMVWLFNRWQIAGTAALSKTYAATMGANAQAAKVYALMVDYVAGTSGVADTIPAAPVPNVAAIPAKVSSTVTPAVNAPIQASAPVLQTQSPIVMRPTVSTPAAPAPVSIPATPTPVAATSSGATVTDSDVAQLIAQMQAQGASQTSAINAALQQLESQGVNTQAPAVQQAVSSAVSPGISMKDILLGVAALVGIYLIVER